MGNDGYRLFINEDSTIMVTMWDNGSTEVATRPNSSHTWGPPVKLEEQK